MAQQKDWLPGKEADLVLLMAVWQTRLSTQATITAYGWPSADCTALIALITAFTTARTLYQGNRIKSNREAKDIAKKSAATGMRNFANNNIRYNAKMTLQQKEELGILPRDTEPTPIPPPVAQPEATVSYPAPHQLKLHLRAREDAPPDPHKSDYGYRVYWGILPQGGASVEVATGPKRELMRVPTDPDELPHSRFTRRARMDFDFPLPDQGKTVYFCIRFENAKGEPGPWGPMFPVVIP